MTADDWRVRALKAETTVERLTREIERHREDAARLVASEQETRRERDRLRADLSHFEHTAHLIHDALGCEETHARGAEIVCALGRADLRLPEHAALVYRACDLPADLRALLADHLGGVTWVAEYRETSAVRALTRGHDAAWLSLDGRHFALWSEAPCPLCSDETPEVG